MNTADIRRKQKEMLETDTLHPFEKAGLGKAPFRYAGSEVKIGPIQLGGGLSVGAPGQPMGTCDYCGTGISVCYTIESAEGNRFVVGCVCVNKIYKASNCTASQLARDPVYQKIKADKRDRDRKLRHERETAKITAGRQWAEEHRSELEALPNPYRAGENLWQQYEWFMLNAGNRGRIRILSTLKKLL